MNLRSSRRLRLLLFRERGKKISRGQSVGHSQSVVCIFVRNQREREREREEREGVQRELSFFFFSSPPLSSFFCPFGWFLSAPSCFFLARGNLGSPVRPKKNKQKKRKEKKRFSHQSSGPYLGSEGETKKKNRRKIEHHPFLFCSHSLSFKKPLFLCWDLQSTRTRALGKKIARARLSFDYLFLYSDRESVDSTEKLFFPRVRGKPRASFSLQTPKSKNKIYRSLFRCDTSSTVHHALLNAVASHRIARAMSRR